MKINTIGNSVDLEAPIQMQEDQLEKLTIFLKDLLGEEIEIKDVEEKERLVNTPERHPKKWTSDELFMLLNPHLDSEDIASKLGRSHMSVAMHRANFVPAFISWTKSKGYNSDKISKTLVEEFMVVEK